MQKELGKLRSQVDRLDGLWNLVAENRNGAYDKTDALLYVKQHSPLEPSRCTCPGGTPNSALGWHSACPLHGIKAQQEKASAPPCGNPVMINSERYRGCRLPSGHNGDCSPQSGSDKP